MARLEGTFAASYSPLSSNGEIDANLIKPYYDFLKNNDVSGTFINGSTGDFVGLTIAERNELLTEWCNVADDDFIKIAHVGDLTLKNCQLMAEHAGNSGVDAVSILSPSYFKPQNLQALLNFCSEVASVNPEIPFLYYHIPALTGVGFDMTEFLRKGKELIPNLTGIKFTEHDLMHFKRTLEFSSEFDVLFGVDEILISALALGAKGWVGSTYSHLPAAYHKMINLYRKGSHTEASQMQYQIMEFIRITAEHGWAGGSKHLLTYNGLNMGPVRPPHKNLNSEEVLSLKEALEYVRFFDLLNHNHISELNQSL